MRKLTVLGDQRRTLEADALEDTFAVAICLMSIGFEIPKAIKTCLVLTNNLDGMRLRCDKACETLYLFTKRVRETALIMIQMKGHTDRIKDIT